MKKIVYAILIIFLSLPLSGYTIKGGVTYTVEQARQEAFANVEYTLPQSIIKANKVDPNYKENMKAKANGINKLADRYVTYFSDGGYGVVYTNNPYYEYYYDVNGKLENIAKKDGLIFPFKTYKYDLNGNIEIVMLDIAASNTYVFDANGQLKGHWINDKCYDLNGKVISRRYE